MSRIEPATIAFPFVSESPEQTAALGAELGRILRSGDVVALYGNLGSGKTHLAKGICLHFGIAPSDVTSPTFTVVNEYPGTPVPIYHIDAYRIEHEAEFHELGYETYFYGDGICLVEWPERIERLLPTYTLRLRLEHEGENRRRIERLSP